MEEINRIKRISIWIFIVPIIVLNLCLFISVNYDILENTIFKVDQIGRSGFTIPYIDGSLSISRASRTYPTYLLFKPGMIITAILLIKYWMANGKLFKKIKIALSPGQLNFQVPRQRSRPYWSLVMLNILEQIRAFGPERIRVVLNSSKTPMYYPLTH